MPRFEAELALRFRQIGLREVANQVRSELTALQALGSKVPLPRRTEQVASIRQQAETNLARQEQAVLQQRAAGLIDDTEARRALRAIGEQRAAVSRLFRQATDDAQKFGVAVQNAAQRAGVAQADPFRAEARRVAAEETQAQGQVPLRDLDDARRAEANNRAAAAADQAATADQAAAGAAGRKAAADTKAAAATDSFTVQDARNQAQENLASRRQQIAVREQERLLLNSGRFPDLTGGTFFQRAQAQVQNRVPGGPVRLPGEFATGGQFFQQKFLSTAGFAASGALLFGAISGISQLITESAELQRILVAVEAQFEATGKAAQFPEAREAILQIARDTGVGADQVANVLFQFQGAFQDTPTAIAETEAAIRGVVVTGLELTEVIDSLTALRQIFGATADEIFDKAIGLEERFGVLARETVQFTAELAPVAKEAGLEFDELATLGAIAQQASGRSAGFLSEQFGRIIPTVRTARREVVQLFEAAGRPQTAARLDDAFRAGDLGTVFGLVLQDIDDIDQGTQQALTNVLGGRREAQTIASLFEQARQRPSIAEEFLNPPDDSGKALSRFEAQVDTVQLAGRRLAEAFRILGERLFEAGLADGLTALANVGGFLVDVLTRMAEVLATLNDVTGGHLGEVLLLVAAYKGLAAAAAAVVGSQAAAGLAGALRAGAAGAVGGAAGQIPGQLALFGQAAASGGIGNLLSQAGQAPVNGVPGRPGFGLALAGAATAAFFVGDVFQNQQQNVQAAEQDFRNRAKEFSQERLSEIADINVGIMDRISSALFGTDLPQTIAAVQFNQNANEELGLSENFAAVRDALEAGNQTITGAFNQLRNGLNSGDLTVPEGTTNEAAQAVTQLINGDAAQKQEVIDEAVAGNADALQALQIVNDYLLAQEGITDELAGFIGENEELRTSQARQMVFTLSVIQAAVEAGRATNGELLSAINDEIAELRTNPPADASPEDTARQIFELITQRQTTLLQIATDARDFREAIRSATGQDTSRQTVQEALRLVRTPGINLNQQIELVPAALQALQAAFNERLERIKDPVERLRVQEQGFRIPPDLRRLAIAGQIRDPLGATAPGEIDSLLTQISGASGQSGNQIIEEVAERIRSTDETLEQATIAVIQRQIANLRSFLAVVARVGDQEAIDSIRSRIDDLNEILYSEGVAGLGGANIDELSGRGGVDSAATRQARDAARQERQQVAQARIQLEVANAGGDTLRVAQLELRGAILERQNARTEQERLQADAAIIRARQRVRDEVQAIAVARLQLLQQAAAGDPVRQAALGLQIAQLELAAAEGERERLDAQAQVLAAEQEAADAQDAIARARLQLLQARVQRNPAAAARIGLQLAQLALSQARGEEERLQAQIEIVNAQQQLRQAILDILLSQSELVQAIAEAAGDIVGAAQAGLEQAQIRLREVLSDPNSGQAERNRARADVIRARAAVRDARLADRMGDIDFLLEMEQITTAQAITMLQSLLRIPKLTEEQIRSIQRKIQSLRDELGRDFQFNLPTELALPTVFEVRRAEQTGSRAFTDQRQVNIELNIANSADLAELERIMSENVGTNVNGTINRRY